MSAGEPMELLCNMCILVQKSLGVQERSDKDLPWVGAVGRREDLVKEAPTFSRTTQLRLLLDF